MLCPYLKHLHKFLCKIPIYTRFHLPPPVKAQKFAIFSIFCARI
ncbi:hypothetical protein HHE014_15940 [Helicobacter heilmannii]|nr:hypothetical protein HHE014_15940 [Helicobacter heilmannii]